MPMLAPPVIAALISAAATATTTGLEAAGTFSPSMGAEEQQQQQLATQNQQKQQQAQAQEAFKAYSPNAQAQTGGSLGDPAMASLIAELSGAPADTNLAQQTIFGNAPGLSTGG